MLVLWCDNSRSIPFRAMFIHCVLNCISFGLVVCRSVKPKALEGSNRIQILVFSVIFALNIAIGNTSLRWVSVNFNQVMRALVPAIVMAISMVWSGKTYTTRLKMAVVPIVIGVAMTFYGDLEYTMLGATYTFACVFLAALKAVVGGEILTGELKLHPMDLISKMCPLALLQIGFLAVVTGEMSDMMDHWDELISGPAPRVVLLSGVLAFTLNVSSFIANKVTSPLTLCIAANVKQVSYSFDTISYLIGCRFYLFCLVRCILEIKWAS